MLHFCSLTLYQFVLRIATGLEFGNALHYREKGLWELIMFCNALHYRIICFAIIHARMVYPFCVKILHLETQFLLCSGRSTVTQNSGV